MAMDASRLTQDQNLDVHFDGVKINGPIAQKNKGGLGGRKASGKPSALQPSKKHNTKNVGEDSSIVTKKAPVSGRKALGDLTNLAIPPSQKNGLKNKMSQIKKAIAFADHEAQKKSMAACFQSVSACNNPPKKVKDESGRMIFEMEEMLVHGGMMSPIRVLQSCRHI
ncbi:putative protein Patronus [Helianthus anomalus]